MHLQPSEPGWLDMGLGVPLLDCSRAERELGLRPAHPAGATLLELLEGMHAGAGAPTPPLAPARRRGSAAAEAAGA